MFDSYRLIAAYEKARADLISEQCHSGHWEGELCSSPLSTATAVSALSCVANAEAATHHDPNGLLPLIERGLDYVARIQNSDGGWGDTDKSLSNIATTMLVRAAIHLAHRTERFSAALQSAEEYLEQQGHIAGLKKRYGRDKTFAVPILTNCALAGLVPWNQVSPLPFELACFPHGFYRFLQLPVVSYAIPALVAIGQARHFHARPLNPFSRLTRWITKDLSLRVVRRMQPESGGFLEATPLTSFVVMSLASIEQADHPIVQHGVRFLIDSIRDDGSWPIDTNLATWVTTLAINALDDGSTPSVGNDCLQWLLDCQHRVRHPFTNADPGGWGWTDLSGAVPDADDTPGALLALSKLSRGVPDDQAERIRDAAKVGVQWLLGLQNHNGGWPTFCRGWGKLPFDRSSTDLTAHALRALHVWRDVEPDRIPVAIQRAFHFLNRQQLPDGSWMPLWFGNQHRPDEQNPVYGTARVLLAYRDLNRLETDAACNGLQYLAAQQRPDGGWGAASCGKVSSVEETAVALEALLASPPDESTQTVITKGLEWLLEAVEQNRHRDSTPIGFYFARLWYYERLYPLVFTVSALQKAVARMTLT